VGKIVSWLGKFMGFFLVLCYESRTKSVSRLRLTGFLGCCSVDTATSTSSKKEARGGTRIPCEIPVVLIGRDPADPFQEPCNVILANLAGCAVRAPRPVPTGTAVELEGLPTQTQVAARVVNCISLGEYERLWLLGLALEKSGNVWGLDRVPDDWAQQK
jgi:hypothetical protein